MKPKEYDGVIDLFVWVYLYILDIYYIYVVLLVGTLGFLCSSRLSARETYVKKYYCILSVLEWKMI